MVKDIKFDISDELFNKDPQDSKLGHKILEHSILLIDEIGLEAFTFKKLALEIGSAEKSIYRYFENKHVLLLFLSSWYWEWVYYLIHSNSKNIKDPVRKLEIAIEYIVKATDENPLTTYINENVLHKVIINEGSKAYHTFSIDAENKAGCFLSFKNLAILISNIIHEIKPGFKYHHSLSSNLLEMANNQVYFSDHLPKLSSIKKKNTRNKDLIKMLEYFSKKILDLKV